MTHPAFQNGAFQNNAFQMAPPALKVPSGPPPGRLPIHRFAVPKKIFLFFAVCIGLTGMVMLFT
jgi:hypothetical protein